MWSFPVPVSKHILLCICNPRAAGSRLEPLTISARRCGVWALQEYEKSWRGLWFVVLVGFASVWFCFFLMWGGVKVMESEGVCLKDPDWEAKMWQFQGTSPTESWIKELAILELTSVMIWAAGCSGTPFYVIFMNCHSLNLWVSTTNTCGRFHNDMIMINSKKLHSGQGADLMVVWAQGRKEDSEFQTLYLCLTSDCYLELQSSTFLLSCLSVAKKNVSISVQRFWMSMYTSFTKHFTFLLRFTGVC